VGDEPEVINATLYSQMNKTLLIVELFILFLLVKHPQGILHSANSNLRSSN
jgi:hypothetical protein